MFGKKRFEKSGTGKCICCYIEEIEKHTFECGHIQSRANGGSDQIDNLEPICKSCNGSMATTHMFEFMKQYNLEGLKFIKDYEGLEIKYNEWTEHNKENKKIYNVPNPVPNRAPNPVNNHETLTMLSNRLLETKMIIVIKAPAINTTTKILGQLKKHQEVQLIAPTQSGKSDIIIRLARLIKSNQDYFEKIYDLCYICIIICASDIDLKRDLCQKINNPKIQVCHLPDILKSMLETLNKVSMP